ncbi:hypothetical protein [Black pepper virus B]|nr:hypothetical protein [Black pepper virus B]
MTWTQTAVGTDYQDAIEATSSLAIPGAPAGFLRTSEQLKTNIPLVLQLNTLIELTCKLHDKVEKLNTKVSAIEGLIGGISVTPTLSKDLEALQLAISKIQIGEKPISHIQKVYWRENPRDIFKEVKESLRKQKQQK